MFLVLGPKGFTDCSKENCSNNSLGTDSIGVATDPIDGMRFFIARLARSQNAGGWRGRTPSALLQTQYARIQQPLKAVKRKARSKSSESQENRKQQTNNKPEAKSAEDRKPKSDKHVASKQ